MPNLGRPVAVDKMSCCTIGIYLCSRYRYNFHCTRIQRDNSLTDKTGDGPASSIKAKQTSYCASKGLTRCTQTQNFQCPTVCCCQQRLTAPQPYSTPSTTSSTQALAMHLHVRLTQCPAIDSDTSPFTTTPAPFCSAMLYNTRLCIMERAAPMPSCPFHSWCFTSTPLPPLA